MDDFTIPAEAVEELIHCIRRITGVEIKPEMAEDITEAILKAWPGMRQMEEQRAKTIQWVPWRIKQWKYKFLHLPLPARDEVGKG
jgi:DNA replicative helicase MCM subunit Mcm2 (Cdc46/Mcm family)